jgi:paraquat-inducible protein B
MSKQVSKTAIGGFVLAAIGLLIVSIIAFGGGKFLKKTDKYVLFFESSVKGLSVGATVIFRGVRVGSVTSIVLRSNLRTLVATIPVVIEIERDKIEIEEEVGSLYENRQRLIERGLRAELSLESLVTGQMMVELDFKPDTPIKLVGAETKYPEIPTVVSALDRLAQSIQNLPIEELFNKIMGAVEGISKVVNSPDLMAAVQSLNLAVNDARKLLQDVDAQVEPLANTATRTMNDFGTLAKDVDQQVDPLAKEATGTLRAYRKLARDVDAKVDPLSKSAIAAMKAAESAIKSIDDLVGKDSPTVADLDTTLQELSEAARSLRILADYLEQHPDAIIKGKGY